MLIAEVRIRTYNPEAGRVDVTSIERREARYQRRKARREAKRRGGDEGMYKINIQIEGEIKKDSALVFTVQEREADAFGPIQFHASNIDDVVSVIEKRLSTHAEK